MLSALYRIFERLIDLMAGKTVIAIAHRLSTIARMDRLVVMDAGRIIEIGSHAQLLVRGGLYARQTGGFLAGGFLAAGFLAEDVKAPETMAE